MEITKHDFLEVELKDILKETRRQEPGISITEMSKIIKGIYAPCEIESLKKELK